MPEFSGYVPGAVLTVAAFRDIEKLIQPFSLSALRGEVAHVRRVIADEDYTQWLMTPDSAAKRLAAAQQSIDEGGTVFHYIWQVTDGDGVKHQARGLASVEPFPLQHLDGYRDVSVVIRSFEHNLSPAPQEAQVKLDTQGDGIRFTATAPANSVLTLGREIEDTLRGYVDAEKLRSRLPPFKVFIGHGGDPQWKYLQRALIDTHNIRAEAFESSERAGYRTLVVVDQMVRSSAVAVVIMTGEDIMPDGSRRARENVVHEIGFCQGALGIDRTIIVMEEDISEPSNVKGLTQIRFPQGRLIDIEDRIVSAIQQRQQAHDYSAAT